MGGSASPTPLGHDELSAPSSVEHSLFEKVEVASAIHAALEQFQPVDVAFDGSLTVPRNDRGLNRRQILTQLDHKGAEFRYATVLRAGEPRGQGVRIAIPKQLLEADEQRIGERNFRVSLTDAGPGELLVRGQGVERTDQQADGLPHR